MAAELGRSTYIMIDRPKLGASARIPDDPAGSAAVHRNEAEHARRNALQMELLRVADRREAHRTFIDQALRRVRQDERGLRPPS
jgi:hypothetical protein